MLGGSEAILALSATDRSTIRMCIFPPGASVPCAPRRLLCMRYAGKPSPRIHCWGDGIHCQVIRARPTTPSPERGEGGVRGAQPPSKYREAEPPHPVLLPAGEKGRSSSARDSLRAAAPI